MVNGPGVGGIGLGGIVAGFVAVIIGLTFFVSIGDTVGTMTGTFTTLNESFTALNNTDVAFTTDSNKNVTAITAVRNNASITLINSDGVPGNFTQVVANRTIKMNISYSDNQTGNTGSQTWFVDYTYQTNDFIEDGAVRSITNLIPLFFALAIMAASLIFVDFRRFGFG